MKFKSILLFISTISLIFLSIRFSKESIQAQQIAPIYPLPFVEHLTVGYSENMADFLWLRAIQDFSFCEKKDEKGNCQAKGWIYQMLTAIAKLSPEFKTPMLTGPIVMSVIIGDLKGASDLFDYAVVKFPLDWSIAYRAGYHAMAEEKNNEKAGRLMEQAARNGAPGWVYNLATKLYTKSGEKEVALKLYQELKNTGNFNPDWLKEMRTRMGIEE